MDERLALNFILHFQDLQKKILKLSENESLDDVDSCGCAALHYIVTGEHKNKSSLIQMLIINGANVDLTTTDQGFSALHLAVKVYCVYVKHLCSSSSTHTHMHTHVHMQYRHMHTYRHMHIHTHSHAHRHRQCT